MSCNDTSLSNFSFQIWSLCTGMKNGKPAYGDCIWAKTCLRESTMTIRRVSERCTSKYQLIETKNYVKKDYSNVSMYDEIVKLFTYLRTHINYVYCIVHSLI